MALQPQDILSVIHGPNVKKCSFYSKIIIIPTFQNKFYNAVETSQRVDKYIVAKDTKQIQQILGLSESITDALEKYSVIIMSTSSLAQESMAVDLISGDVYKVNLSFSSEIFISDLMFIAIYDVLQIDKSKLNEHRNLIYDTLKNSEVKTKATTRLEFITSVNELVIGTLGFYNNGTGSVTIDALTTCTSQKNMNHSLDYIEETDALFTNNELRTDVILNALYPNAPPSYINEISHENFEDCERIFLNFTEIIKENIRLIERNVSKKYFDEYMNDEFPDTVFNFSSIKHYEECVTMETKTIRETEETITIQQTMMDMLEKLSTTSNINSGLQIVKELSKSYENIVRDGMYSDSGSLSASCKKVTEYIKNTVYMQDVTDGNYKEMEKILQSAETSLDKIRKTVSKFKQNYEETSHSIDYLKEYLSSNMTKSTLFRVLIPSLKSLDKIQKLNEDLIAQIREYSSLLSRANVIHIAMYRININHEIPLLTKNNVDKMEIVKLSNEITDPGIQEIVNSLKSDVSRIDELVTDNYERLEKGVEGMIDELVTPSENLLQQLDDFEKDLEIYKASTIVDVNFFM